VTPLPTAPADAPPSPGDRDRAAVVAAAAVALARARGVALDPGLRLFALAGPDPADVPADPAPAATGDPAEALGAALERATDGGRRRAQGLHVTPGWLARLLTGMALDGLDGMYGAPVVCDPACGGGVFLVAAAERLHARGIDRADVVRHLVFGADIDPVGLAAAEAALALWAGEAPPPGRLVVGDPLASGPDLWPARPPGGVDAVVGNPPFQSQLGRATARTAADRRRLKARYGDAVRAYTDTAWLFLLLGVDLARPGGRVVLVEPRSLVAARDAEAVRAAVDRRADLRRLWVDDAPVFAASVRVCAPVLEPRTEPALGDGPGPSERWRGLWADALGVPRLPGSAGPTLGDRATVLAGFRDQYYGLVAAVREHDPADPPAAVAPLVTSGAIDWCASAWGRRPVRYAKARWRAPVVDLARLAALPSPAAQRWVARTRRPKLVVATQTRVVEAAVDAAGAWVPSVPTLAVLPRGDEDLWRLAAALAAPAATAWLLRRAAGTALGVRALKVSAPDLAALPLPADRAAWDDAAAAVRAVVADPTPAAVDAYLAAAAAAYGSGPDLTAWWRAQAGRKPGPAVGGAVG
jgi:N-6 DNA Methylase